jgi:hypothetical protein
MVGLLVRDSASPFLQHPEAPERGDVPSWVVEQPGDGEWPFG